MTHITTTTPAKCMPFKRIGLLPEDRPLDDTDTLEQLLNRTTSERSLVMAPTEINGVLRNALAGRLSYESRDVGRGWGILKGPYYQHNQLVRHANKLKTDNRESSPRYFRLFPLGGGFHTVTDALLFVLWLLVLVFPLASIGTACFCKNVVNIVSAVILAILLICQIICMRLANSNWKKLKRCWYVAKITTKNYYGAENRFSEVTLENIHQNEHFNKTQKQTIFTKLKATESTDTKATVMVVTESYWKTKVLDPMIALSFVGVLCLISLIFQLEFYNGMES